MWGFFCQKMLVIKFVTDHKYIPKLYKLHLINNNFIFNETLFLINNV